MILKIFDINENTILNRKADQIFSEVDGEVVMLNMTNSEYYNLNMIGSQIWKLIEAPTRLKDLTDKLIDIYDVSAEDCTLEINSFISELNTLGLIELKNG